jgi:hypothetical protein
MFIAIDATRRATVTAAVPDTPPIVPTTLVVPAASAVMRPAVDTLATVGALDVHVAVRVLLVPFDSVANAVAVIVSPSTSATVTGAIATVATESTDTLADALLPPIATEIVALPGATATTFPSDATVATFVALDVHVGVNVVLFDPSDVVTASASFADSPVMSDALAGVRLTDVTVTGGTTGPAGSPPPPHCTRPLASTHNAIA